MNYINNNRISTIESLFNIPIEKFIQLHIIFASLSLYIEEYCLIPRILKRDFENSEISFYTIDCKQIPTITIGEIFKKLEIKTCIFYYCNFPDNHPICSISEKILYVRSPLELRIDLMSLNQLTELKFSRISRILKINIK